MSVARAISRIGRVPSVRPSTSFLLARNISTNPQSYKFKACVPAILTLTPHLNAQFSTTLRAFEKEGMVDEELAAKIQLELKLEERRDGDDDMPPSVREFLENSPFKVIENPGEQEVELIREFGDETIRVEFSIADLNSDDLDESNLFNDDEDVDTTADQSSGVQSKATKADGRVSATNEEEFDDDEDTPISFPSRVNVTIEKANGGALQFEAVAQDGMIVIENVFYHKSTQLATAKTANADWERRGLYAGPPFGNLDEDLQVLLERYLDERGINTALALFIPDYIDYKEQKEYVSWLRNVKNFVEC